MDTNTDVALCRITDPQGQHRLAVAIRVADAPEELRVVVCAAEPDPTAISPLWADLLSSLANPVMTSLQPRRIAA